jgi:hypothetical protein
VIWLLPHASPELFVAPIVVPATPVTGSVSACALAQVSFAGGTLGVLVYLGALLVSRELSVVELRFAVSALRRRLR